MKNQTEIDEVVSEVKALDMPAIIIRFLNEAARTNNWHYVLTLQWLLNCLESATMDDMTAFDLLMVLHAKGE